MNNQKIFREIYNTFITDSTHIYVHSEMYINISLTYEKFIENFTLKQLEEGIFSCTFIYAERVLKVFPFEKYYQRYTKNIFNFRPYKKVKILKKGSKNGFNYIEFQKINGLDTDFVFKSIDMSYKKLELSSCTQDIITTLPFIDVSRRVDNLYEFYAVFLLTLKKKGGFDKMRINNILSYLKSNKKCFLDEKKLYFIHGDLGLDHFLYDDKNIYIIDFGRAGYFDYHYDLFGLHKHIGINEQDLEKICINNNVVFSKHRYNFCGMLYSIID